MITYRAQNLCNSISDKASTWILAMPAAIFLDSSAASMARQVRVLHGPPLPSTQANEGDSADFACAILCPVEKVIDTGRMLLRIFPANVPGRM